MTASGEAASADLGLRVRVLGGFAVEGREERALGTRKARVLLKRLAVAGGQSVPVDEIAAAVWGGDLPQNPADQVSVLVSRLRSVLGAGRLPRSDAGYRLAADWLDLVELERTVSELEERLREGETGAALAASHAALGLARGPLLPEEDGDWVDAARPGAERLLAQARLLAAEAAVAAGELGAARAAAQSVLDHDPYDEAALRLVMRADALAGRPGAALAVYAAVRYRLSEDLGADPTAETERLHTAIVRGEVPTLSETMGSGSLVGRDAEMALLDALLATTSEGASQAAVIEADAGMGKSTLLSAWLARVGATSMVISGRCDALGDDLPLQPIVDGVIAHLDALGRDAAAELVGPDAAVLDPILGRVATEKGVGATTLADPEASRTTLFAALAALLRRAAGERPLVLVVDDLHVAPAGTAEFLGFAVRRISRSMMLTTRRPQTGPDLPAAQRIVLGPLSVADAVALVGAERGPALHERSGGHPLFLQELAAVGDGELPASIVAAVRAQLDRLGPAAVSLQAAAGCGTEVDAALLAAVTGRPVPVVLDDLEQAMRAGLLRPRGAALGFRHELVREAVEAATSPPRKVEVHRAAVAELARRPNTDPLALARHARLGGDPAIAADALVVAAGRAKERFEVVTAEELLDQAIGLCDSVPARLARGQLRLARLDLDGARGDAQAAIQLGAGVDGFELAGWVAYYARDYDTALRYADEGVERAAATDVRASCLALAGRIRHTRGVLADASALLEEGVAIAPAGIRGMVQVWHAQLLAHQGHVERAADVAQRGLLDPHLAHPFAAGHGRFTLAYALGLSGHWAAAMGAVDELDALVARRGDRRFPPVAANIRGWLLRGAGLLDEAVELHRFAVEAAPGPTFQEAHYAALLDLAECHLGAGDIEQAAESVDAARGILEWSGSMSWRHRNRYRLLTDRIASLSGDHLDALGDARAVAAAAAERGDRRYHVRALLVAAAIQARSGRPVDQEEVGPLVEHFLPLSGPDGWRDLAEVAAALGSEKVWHLAEKQAASIVAEVSARPGFDADWVSRSIRHQIDRLRP